MRKTDYDKNNRRYHYHSINEERARNRRGYYSAPKYKRDVERDEQPSMYDQESDDYDAHPYYNRKRRIGRHNDRNFLQEIGHNMKQAWDEWAKDDTRIDNPQREDTFYPNDYTPDHRYERTRIRGERTPSQVTYIDDYTEHDSYVRWPRRRYISDDLDNIEEEKYYRDDYEFEHPQFSGNDRRMGMRWRSREKRGKHVFKYGHKK